MLTVTEVPVPASVASALAADVAAPGPKRRLLRRPGTAFLEERAAEARRVLDAGRCEAVEVRHAAPPGIVTHEHGIMLLTALDAGRTHMLDVSSVGDDPRWELYTAGGLVRREWRWLRLGALGRHGFAASGEPLEAVVLGDLHGSALEVLLTEGESGWPGDDAIIEASFDALARLATIPPAA